MCAEYTPGQPMETEKLLEAAELLKKILDDDWEGLRVFPRNQAPIIRKNEEGELEMVAAEFSLIPSWWNPEKADKKTKNDRPVFATHNARIETIDEKPTFKDPFKNKHCLVPIKDFFESSVFGEKFPGNRVRISTGGVLLAAGCYTEWIDKRTGEVILSFTIITHIPNTQIFEAGHDRMPVFLGRKAAMQWLENEKEKPAELKEFLLKHNANNLLKFDISVDRALKDGWKKNAPDEKDLEELKKLVKKTS
jgi:putative SOS response-associated peptidase YedK